MPVHLRPATELDVAAMADISTKAFHPDVDAVSRMLFPVHLQPAGTTSTQNIKQWAVVRKSRRLSAKRTVMMVAVDDGLNNRAIGYALWIRPAQEGDDEEPLPPPIDFPGMDKVALAQARDIMMKEETDTFGDKGSGHVWVLDSLGVDPEQQRRGIGRLLLNWGVEQAKADKKDCHLLATPVGVPLYRAAGFEGDKVVEVFGDHYVSMMRKTSQE